MSYNDPMDAVDNAGQALNHFYGRMDVGASFVRLVKGVGAEVFDDVRDDPKERRTQVTVSLNPIEASNLTMLVERKMIAESNEWAKITWASLRDNCGLKKVRDLHNKWAKVEMVGTGRTYTNKRGQISEATTFRFMAVFNTAAECTAAYWAERGTEAPVDNGVMDVDMSHNGAAAPATANGAPVMSNVERDTALQFLGALVKQAGGDKGKLSGMILQMAPIAKYFTVDSPEVVSLIAGFAGVR